MMRRWTCGLVCLLGIMTPNGVASDENVLRYAAGLGVNQLNPMLASHGWCEVSSMIFSRLYRAGHDGRMEFDLLESATFSEDLLTLTLGLREDVTWHDGQPFTSKDVLFTFGRLFDPKTETDFDKDLTSIDSFVADGDHRVVVRFKRPDPHLDGRLSEVPMLPAHLLRGENLSTTKFNEKPIGTGPYKFDRVEWDGIVWLKAHEGYHSGAPKIRRIRVEHVANDELRARMIAEKKVDMGCVKPQHLDLLKPLGEKAVKRFSSGAWRALVLNYRRTPTSEGKVRQAIAMAIDRGPIVKKALDGFGKPAFVPMVPGSWAYPATLEVNEMPRVGEAIKLLDDAEWVASKSDGARVRSSGCLIAKMTLKLIVWKDETFRMRTAEILKKQLTDIGFDVELHLHDNRGYNERASDMGEVYNGFIGGWGGLVDPIGNIYRKFHTEGSQNHAGYSNKAVDELIEKAMKTADRFKSAKHLAAAIDVVLDDVVFIPLVYPDYVFAVSRPINNLPSGPIDSWYEITKHAYLWSFE